ncbi:MAG: radical SAM protein [Candidatus Aminicenantes bacterium RBG_13_62_12]|nr:MAG: radical SAM protein [Candidatus Aminicenantes bacterium RBG_13_62_12]
MAKIVFIEPQAPNLHIFSQFPLPRLGTLILGTMMKKRGFEVEVFVEDFRKIDFDVVASADLVGISTITSTAPRAYAIADRVRAMGIPVLMGGPHVTYVTEEALEHADFVVRGEGEAALAAFIDARERGEGFADVPSLSYKDAAGKVVHNPMAPRAADLDRIPFPDFTLLRPDAKGPKHMPSIPVLTSRGCPFDCSFCSVTGMFGRKYRFRSTANIIEELRLYNDRKTLIFFYDDNFAADPKRTRDLCEAMIREKFRFKWTTQVRADIARDPDLVRLMKKAGCHTVYIGFESVNPDSLEGMKKSQTVAEIARAVKVFRRCRIHIHGMFVLGFDEDDWKSVRKTVRFARKARLTSTQFLILTPLPGSAFYDRIASENRIRFHDWALYDAHHAVFQPARFSLPDLQKAQIFAHRKFYSLKETVRKIAAGQWLGVAIAHYARNLNRTWKRRNRTFLRVVKLLKPRPGARGRVSVDYHEDINLE